MILCAFYAKQIASSKVTSFIILNDLGAWRENFDDKTSKPMGDNYELLSREAMPSRLLRN